MNNANQYAIYFLASGNQVSDAPTFDTEAAAAAHMRTLPDDSEPMYYVARTDGEVDDGIGCEEDQHDNDRFEVS